LSNILITGSGKGLGLALSEELENQGHNVFGYDIGNGDDVRRPDLSD